MILVSTLATLILSTTEQAAYSFLMKDRHKRIQVTIYSLVLALFLGALSGCVPTFDPPPGYRGGFLWNTDRSRVVKVLPGDTVYTLSRRYDVPSQSIISRNGLLPPYILSVGQDLILDSVSFHRVVKGDTLSGLARSYGIDMGLMASMNSLSPPYTIYVGQELWIPDPFAVAAAPPPSKQFVNPSESVVSPQPTSSRLQKAERASPPETDLVEVVPPIPAPPERASSRFSWPLTGRLLSQFGPAGPGLHNDGINIAAPKGTAVRAAENGVVAYAGSELRGFGNLLLIKHTGGWITAYAHNDDLLVRRGEEVKVGQVVAHVGQTGGLDVPQLHFEIRKGARALDPALYLSQAPGG